ncbi:alpha-amylase-related protein-like [Amblyomma americanum]
MTASTWFTPKATAGPAVLSWLIVIICCLPRGAVCVADGRFNDPKFFGGRSTIVQLFEWAWPDVAQECVDFLGPFGYGAVQVSPPSENAVLLYKTPGGVSVRSWYERYEPVSYKIVSPSGDMEEFADMVRRCNESQVRVFVDVVLNHMTSSIGEGFGYGGTPFSSDNFAYDGVPYRASDFHSRAECGTVSGLVEDYTNVVQVRNCKFRDRADLNHKLESVRSKIVDYLKRLLSVGVSGFRIDGADYMWPEDLEVIYDRLKGTDGAETETASEGFSEAPAQAPEEAVAMTEGGTPSDTQASTVQDATLVKDRETATPAWTASLSEDPFMYHEMSTLNLRWTKEYARIGAVTSATFFKTYANALNQAQESTLKTLRPFIMGDVALSPVQVVYVDSHETQRGVDVADAVADVVSHRDRKRHVLATVLMLAQPHGIARVMSSYALDRKFDTYVPPKMLGAPFDHMFNTLPVLMKENYECYNGWICEHRWLPIRNMIRFRNGVADAPATNWWDDDADAVAFARLRRGFVLVNNGRSVVRGLFNTTLPGGYYCDLLTGSRVDERSCSGDVVRVRRDGFAQLSVDAAAEVPAVAIQIEERVFPDYV